MTQLANLVKDNVALLCIALAVVLVAIIALLVYFILQFIKLKKKHEAFLTGKDGNNIAR